jgi:hypothetical protein
LKINRGRVVIIVSLLLVALILIGAAAYILLLKHISTAILHPPSQKQQKSTVTFTPPSQPDLGPSQPGRPVLEQLEQVTDQAFGTHSEVYVPNSWGVHKSRVIRTSNGDIFTVYTSAGTDENNREWHLMRRGPNGNWVEVNHGNAGVEPINILRGPHDEIHLFAWPGNQGQLVHLESTDLGKTFTSENLAGQWIKDQGYSGCSINDQGDIVFFETGSDKPGQFLWTYYNPNTNSWKFHITTLDYRYTYAFFFPGDNGDLTITAMRDVLRPELGYPSAPSQDFNYVFDTIKCFYISDVNNPTLTTQTLVAHGQPRNDTDYEMTYITDSYVDTLGNVHILYNEMYDGPHEAIIQDGKVIKNVRLNISAAPNKMRIIQDAEGHFYIISMDVSGNYLDIYPGTASDTDGTQLEPAIKINIAKYPGCTDDDFCHSPTFTEPRVGDALSDYIDGTYGNFNQEIYFRILLRAPANTATTSSPAAMLIKLLPGWFPAFILDERNQR